MLVYWLFFFLSLNRAQRNLCGKDSGRFGSIWFAQMSSKWGMKSSFSFFFHFFWFRLNRAVAAHSVRRFSRIFAGCVVHLRCLKITSYCTCSQDRSRLAVSTLGARSKTFVACRLYFVKDRLKVIFLSWRKSARREGRKSGFLFVFVSKWCFLGENEASALFYVLKNWDLGRAWIPWTPACRWSPALAAKCVKVGWCLVLSAWRLSGRKRADMHISRRRDLNCQLICSVDSVEAWMMSSSTQERGASITSQCFHRFIDHNRTRLQHPIHRPFTFFSEAGITLYRRPEGRPDLVCSKAHGRLKHYHHLGAEQTENQGIPSSVRSFLGSASMSMRSELEIMTCAS